MATDRRDVLTPRDLAFGAADHVADESLPMLAAAWLAEGWNSESLVELASMTRAEAREGARRLLPSVLDSLGVTRPGSDPDQGAARYSELVAWAVRAMDGRFVPYSAAQKVLEAVDDDPEAFAGMPGVEELRAALRQVDEAPADRRSAAQQAVRALLLDLGRRLGA